MFQQNITNGPGTGTFTQHTFEILIMLLGAFLLGLWLGWVLWGRYKEALDRLTVENQSLLVSQEALRTELETAKTALFTAETDRNNYAAQVESLNRNNSNLRERVAQLEIDLTETEARNRQVETELGLSFAPETPVEPTDIPLEITQPEPEPEPADFEGEMVAFADDDEAENALAGMAAADAENHMEAFSIVSADPEPEPVGEIQETPAEPELKTPALTTPFVPVVMPMPEPPPSGAIDTSREDLTVVEGIGPKIQELLYQYGIYTYRQLAETEVSRLKEILTAAGPQLAMHEPGTWPSQANLAANDEWDNLKAIQKFLKGGKKPT